MKNALSQKKALSSFFIKNKTEKNNYCYGSNTATIFCEKFFELFGVDVVDDVTDACNENDILVVDDVQVVFFETIKTKQLANII